MQSAVLPVKHCPNNSGEMYIGYIRVNCPGLRKCWKERRP